jgi:hypothetical protein
MANPFATEAKRLSNVVKQELWAETGYTRGVLTVTADGIVPGTLLSETGIAETAAEVVGVAMVEAGGTDVKVLALVKGPAIVSKGGLILGDCVAADVYAALEAKGINVNDTI